MVPHATLPVCCILLTHVARSKQSVERESAPDLRKLLSNSYLANFVKATLTVC